MTAAAPHPAYRTGRRGVIYVGDAGGILPQLPAASVQLAITSPPYHDHKAYGDAPHPVDIGRPQPYADYLEQMTSIWRQCYRLLAPGGKLVFNSANMKVRGVAQPRLAPLHHDLVRIAEAAGFIFYDEIIWLKKHSYTGSIEGRPLFGSYPYPGNPKMLNQLWENIAVMHKPGDRLRQYSAEEKELSRLDWAVWREWTHGVWRIESKADPEHPATFNTELAERIIRLYTFVGETVLDPFAGVGSAIIAADACGRHGIGIELHERYARVARQRGQRHHQLPLDNRPFPHSSASQPQRLTS